MKTIVWDVDDVLNDLTRTWFEQVWRPGHPSCRLRYEELTENPPERLLGVSRAVYLASLDGFRLSAEMLAMPPSAEVLAWFQNHGCRARHIALTAPPLHTAHQSAAWVVRHFGAWIRTFSFVPSPRDGAEYPRYETSKQEYLDARGGADVFLDDTLANVVAARERGIRALLVPRPWNGGLGTLSETLETLTDLITQDAS